INGTLNITTAVNVTEWNASDGYYSITVTANDSSDSSANSSARHFRLDTTSPEISNLRNTSTTNDSSFIEWSCNELCNYSLLWYNSTDLIGLIYNNTFATSHNPRLINLSNVTTYFINLTVWDGAGNPANNDTFNFTTSVTITEDNIAPTYSNFQNNASADTKRNGIVNWSVILQDERGLSYHFFAHNQSGTLTNVSNGTISGTSVFINKTAIITKAQGNYICGQFWVNDTTDNINQTNMSCFTVQNTPPETPALYYPEDGRNYSSIPYINYSSADADGDAISYTIYINGTLNITTAVNVTGWNASDGYYNITVTANDSSDSSANSSARRFRLDATAPSIGLISPDNNAGDTDGNITISYNATDANSITNCSLIWNNKINLTNSSITKDTELGFTLNDLTAGSYNWSINCTDIVGNTGESETRGLSIIISSEFPGDTTDLDLVNISNITRLIIDQPTYGKINFSQSIDLRGGGNLDEHVNISFNRIEINSTALPALNKSAVLYLYNLTFINPRILRDNIPCPSSICTKINYSGGNLKFNVTRFTSYSAEETPTAIAGRSERGGGGGASAGTGCRRDSDCKGNEKCINGKCLKLFDIKILSIDSPIESGQYLNFTYLIKGMADIEGDVIVRFWIEKNNEIILSGQDAIYLGKFEEKIEEANIYIYKDMLGKYDFFVQLNFEGYSVFSHRPIEITITPPTEESAEPEKESEIEGLSPPSFPHILERALEKLRERILAVLIIIISIALLGLIAYPSFKKKKETPLQLTEAQRQAMINRINTWKVMGYDTKSLEEEMEGLNLIREKEILEGENLVIERMRYRLDMWKKQEYKTERLENELNDYLKWERTN
ncbi:hypothetical protein KY358_06875, partial [Candidatus Woesearchaeota archaeon]|nr:hypothetical protein [Candidatus Woesearchaeota archaeon]